jgi:hypothetical protein
MACRRLDAYPGSPPSVVCAAGFLLALTNKGREQRSQCGRIEQESRENRNAPRCSAGGTNPQLSKTAYPKHQGRPVGANPRSGKASGRVPTRKKACGRSSSRSYTLVGAAVWLGWRGRLWELGGEGLSAPTSETATRKL